MEPKKNRHSFLEKTMPVESGFARRELPLPTDRSLRPSRPPIAPATFDAAAPPPLVPQPGVPEPPLVTTKEGPLAPLKGPLVGEQTLVPASSWSQTEPPPSSVTSRKRNRFEKLTVLRSHDVAEPEPTPLSRAAAPPPLWNMDDAAPNAANASQTAAETDAATSGADAPGLGAALEKGLSNDEKKELMTAATELTAALAALLGMSQKLAAMADQLEQADPAAIAAAHAKM